MSSNISECVRQSIVNQDYRFERVITDVADGLKRCGFFNEAGWKDLLITSFEQKRLGVTTGEIRLHTTVVSQDSFLNGLPAQSTSTPVAAGRTSQNETQTLRNKRRPTAFRDARQQDAENKRKKPNNSLDEVEAANILVDLKKADWGQLLPDVNDQKNAVKFVNAFEKSKQLKGISTPSQNRNNDIGYTPQTVSLRDQNPATSNNPITMRRKTVYMPPGKNTTDAVRTVTANNAVLTNITNRRMTRKQSQLLAAYTGSNITERRSTTNYIQRTSVLFTMIDAKEYKDIIQKFNIFVADINEKYDYVITERICRSPKFLSAVVSGKPILSVKWLQALNEKGIWLDPLNFLLKDDNGEKEYNFNLSATLLKATNQRLFENYSILVTNSTTIRPGDLKGVIFSGGGKFLKTTLVPRRGDEVICISDEADKKTWPKLRQKYPALSKIISLDGFATMIFQYTHDVSSADILDQI